MQFKMIDLSSQKYIFLVLQSSEFDFDFICLHLRRDMKYKQKYSLLIKLNDLIFNNFFLKDKVSNIKIFQLQTHENMIDKP